MPWLAEAAVDYWGDLDTHGFAILNQLRAWLPQTQSVLMDRETLLAHRDRWVPEPTPTKATLGRLTCEESALYLDLVTDRFTERVRLEQERVDWQWALERLHGKTSKDGPASTRRNAMTMAGNDEAAAYRTNCPPKTW